MSIFTQLRLLPGVCKDLRDDVSHDRTSCAVTQALAEMLTSTKQGVCFSQQAAPQLKSLLGAQAGLNIDFIGRNFEFIGQPVLQVPGSVCLLH